MKQNVSESIQRYIGTKNASNNNRNGYTVILQISLVKFLVYTARSGPVGQLADLNTVQ